MVLVAPAARAQAGFDRPGVVSHVLVLSDKCKDVPHRRRRGCPWTGSLPTPSGTLRPRTDGGGNGRELSSVAAHSSTSRPSEPNPRSPW